MADCALRVREIRLGETTQVVITHKGRRLAGPFKSREERELVVADAAEAHTLLEALGYEPRRTFEKRRTRYKLDGCLIELDELPKLGTFIEIEGPGDAAVTAVRTALQLDSEPLVESGYAVMVDAYLDERGGSETPLCF